jgi:hypothetical protein
MICKGRPVTRVAKAPDHAFNAQFQVGPAEHRLVVGEIGHQVEAANRRAGVGIDKDRIIGGPCRRSADTATDDKPEQDSQNKARLPLLPSCSHSSSQHFQ